MSAGCLGQMLEFVVFSWLERVSCWRRAEGSRQLSVTVLRRPVQLSAGATAQRAAQLAAELQPVDDEDEHVAGVVRETDLVDDLSHGKVDDIATPRHVTGHVQRPTHGVEHVSLVEHDRHDVQNGRRQRGEDNVERDGEKHRISRRRLGLLGAMTWRRRGPGDRLRHSIHLHTCTRKQPLDGIAGDRILQRVGIILRLS